MVETVTVRAKVHVRLYSVQREGNNTIITREQIHELEVEIPQDMLDVANSIRKLGADAEISVSSGYEVTIFTGYEE